MRELLNENTLFAQLGMHLADSGALVLVVEGDDDHLALSAHCTHGLQLIPGTGGKTQVLKTAALARMRGLDAARFLVDRDYDPVEGGDASRLENVFVSEFHDLFVDLIESDDSLLPRVIEVATASARRRRGTHRPIPSVAEIQTEAMRLATHLAAVRVVNARNSLSLDFGRFSFRKLPASELHARAIAQQVFCRSRPGAPAPAEFLNDVEKAVDEISDWPRPPIGDHDLFDALAHTLARSGVTVKAGSLHHSLILAIRCRSIAGTRWFPQIQLWCAAREKEGLDCKAPQEVAA